MKFSVAFCYFVSFLFLNIYFFAILIIGEDMKKLITSIILLIMIGFIFTNYNEIMYFIKKIIAYD